MGGAGRGRILKNGLGKGLAQREGNRLRRGRVRPNQAREEAAKFRPPLPGLRGDPLEIAAGARVKVVSPNLTPGLENLAKPGGIRWVARTVCKSDLHRADIVIAATFDNRANRKVSRWAKKQKTLVNVVDNSSLSDFISPALLKKRKAIIAVYTDGKDPVLSRDLKNFLKESWGVFLSYRNRL